MAFQTITPFVEISTVDFAADRVSANAKTSIASPFSTIEAFSFGTTTGTAYAKGKAYTFIVLGDPANTDPPPAGSTFNLRKIHFLGLSNDPVIPPFDPTK